jgi:hypothetical protein
MIARRRTVRELTRGRVRHGVLVLLALGLLYALSGGRPPLLAVIVAALYFAWRTIEREQREQRVPDGVVEDAASELDYEQTLEVLLGMVGRDVIVQIVRPQGTPPALASLEGMLCSAESDSHHYRLFDDSYRELEVLFFAIDRSGFWLPRRDFVSAHRVQAAGQVGIELHAGDVLIGVYDDQASRLSEISTGSSA